jgi:hypothetical protein
VINYISQKADYIEFEDEKDERLIILVKSWLDRG